MPSIPEDVAGRVDQVKANLQQQIDETSNNRDLTEDAKTRRIAAAYEKAKAGVKTEQDAWHERSERRAQELNRRVFGSPGSAGVDAISARDADDRASRLEDAGEALALLKRAEDNGDTVLSRAIALRALEQCGNPFGPDEWLGVVNAYAETKSHLTREIQELVNVRSHGSDPIAEGFMFSVPIPVSLSRMSSMNVRALAEQELTR